MPSTSKIEVVEKEYEISEMAIHQLKDVGWNAVKTLLVETRSQTLIKTWASGAEVNLRKKVMRSFFQENMMLENYQPESLVPLIEAHEQWKSFFDHKSNPQSEEGSSNKAEEVEAPNTSKQRTETDGKSI